MTALLSRSEIDVLLDQNGFVRGPRTKKVEGWVGPAGERIFVKLGERYPLVIEPRHESHLGQLLEVPGVIGSPERYVYNSNFSGFPSRVRNGAAPTRYGLDFSFTSGQAVSRFLDILAGRSGSMLDAEQDIASATDLPDDEVERKALIDARRGQGKFRTDLDAHWGSCAVTGCSTRALLRASHIQPWREASNRDKRNPDNGLLLAAHIDAAFDQGLISFADDGRILINTNRLPEADREAVGIATNMQLVKVSAAHRPFLARHRQFHGFA